MEAFLSPLTKAEEEDCIKRLNNNDKSAREQLILHNMRLVAHVTKKYSVNEDESEELITEAKKRQNRMFLFLNR